MPVKRIQDLEGYLCLDNRANGKGLYESATYTCGHCQAQVVMNPKRTRERAYCRKCSHVICDGCSTEMALTLECVPFEKRVDKILQGK